MLKIFLFLVLFAVIQPVSAAPLNFFNSLILKTTKLADSVPISRTDELVGALNKSGIVRKKLDQELALSGKFTPQLSNLVKQGVRQQEVKRLLQTLIHNPDPQLLAKLNDLDDVTRETALILAKGGQNLSNVLPDITKRGRLLSKGGSELVATVGLYGDNAAKQALRLEAALDAGKVIIPIGRQSISLADFGKVMTRFGDSSWTFWQKYVQPHWKIWLTSGALTVYLTNPEFFQDAAGNLTEEGFHQLTALAGAVAAGAVRGISVGTGEAVKQVSEAVQDSFSNNGYDAIGLGLLVLSLLLLLFARIRYYVFLPFRWLMRSPQKKD